MPHRIQTLASLLRGKDELAAFPEATTQLFWFYRLSKPTEVCEYIQKEEEWKSSTMALVELADRVITGLRNGRRVSEAEFATIGVEKKRLVALDQKMATAQNKQRADNLKRALVSFVTDRVKENPLLLTRELAVEVREKGWAHKNKRGELQSVGYLSRLIGPILRKAKADYRAGRL